MFYMHVFLTCRTWFFGYQIMRMNSAVSCLICLSKAPKEPKISKIEIWAQTFWPGKVNNFSLSPPTSWAKKLLGAEAHALEYLIHGTLGHVDPDISDKIWTTNLKNSTNNTFYYIYST